MKTLVVVDHNKNKLEKSTLNTIRAALKLENVDLLVLSNNCKDICNELINIKNINNIFFIFAISHLIIWTLIPSLTNKNLPLDTIEALAWGSNLDWGFNKHPPMSAFFSEVFFQIFGSQDWAYYLLSQIFVLNTT
jgi:hypothetical protein